MEQFEILLQEYKNKLLNNKIKYKRTIFQKLDKKLENHNIVMIGLRQVGKTTLAEQLVKSYYQKFLEDKRIKSNIKMTFSKIVQNDIYYLNLKSFDNIKEHLLELQKYITNNQFGIVFIDEIQMIPNWSSFAQAIIDLNPNTRFIFTGSNAHSLSKEIMTNRVSIFYIKPLLFEEYKTIWNDKSVLNYFKYGSYPKSQNYASVKIQYSEITISQIIDKIIYSDANEKVNATKFKALIKKMLLLVGNQVSYKKLEKASLVSRPTIYSYLNLMINSQLVHKIYKYNDLSGKTASKIYFEDKSMLYLFNDYQNFNANQEGSFVENMVFNYLNYYYESTLTLNPICYFVNSDNKEIDFIIPKAKKIIEVKFYENLDLSKITNDLNNILKSELSDFKKIIVTKNTKDKMNGWEAVPLFDILEGKYVL